VSDYFVSVSPRGTLRIPFIGPSRTPYRYVSAGNVGRGSVSPDELNFGGGEIAEKNSTLGFRISPSISQGHSTIAGLYR
jgi:hypothetical protein